MLSHNTKRYVATLTLVALSSSALFSMDKQLSRSYPNALPPVLKNQESENTNTFPRSKSKELRAQFQAQQNKKISHIDFEAELKNFDNARKQNKPELSRLEKIMTNENVNLALAGTSLVAVGTYAYAKATGDESDAVDAIFITDAVLSVAQGIGQGSMNFAKARRNKKSAVLDSSTSTLDSIDPENSTHSLTSEPRKSCGNRFGSCLKNFGTGLLNNSGYILSAFSTAVAVTYLGEAAKVWETPDDKIYTASAVIAGGQALLCGAQYAKTKAQQKIAARKNKKHKLKTEKATLATNDNELAVDFITSKTHGAMNGNNSLTSMSQPLLANGSTCELITSPALVIPGDQNDIV